MRQPPGPIIVDAAILVAAAHGRNRAALIEAAKAAELITTDRVVQEARRKIELGLKRPELLDIVDALLTQITVMPVAALAPLLPVAERALREAAASRNGSIRDAHVLALAWHADAEIWTTDRDFAGAGIASWSTPNLLRALVQDA